MKIECFSFPDFSWTHLLYLISFQCSMLPPCAASPLDCRLLKAIRKSFKILLYVTEHKNVGKY